VISDRKSPASDYARGPLGQQKMTEFVAKGEPSSSRAESFSHEYSVGTIGALEAAVLNELSILDVTNSHEPSDSFDVDRRGGSNPQSLQDVRGESFHATHGPSPP
jgi:hypothetical protein